MNDTKEMDAMMKSMQEAMEYIVSRLSEKYGFDKAEALEYIQLNHLEDTASNYEYLKYQ